MDEGGISVWYAVTPCTCVETDLFISTSQSRSHPDTQCMYMYTCTNNEMEGKQTSDQNCKNTISTRVPTCIKSNLRMFQLTCISLRR